MDTWTLMHKKVAITGDRSIRAIYTNPKTWRNKMTKTENGPKRCQARFTVLRSSREYRATMTYCSTVFLSAFSHFDIISHKAQIKHCSYRTPIYKARLDLPWRNKMLLGLHRKEARTVYRSVKHRTKQQLSCVHISTIFLMLL